MSWLLLFNAQFIILAALVKEKYYIQFIDINMIKKV